jgi:hypothetical protein
MRTELKASVVITEDGKRRRITKREVIAKQLVNKAAAGDLRAIPLVLGEERLHEESTLRWTPIVGQPEPTPKV